MNSTGKPLYVSRQISRHDPKLEHLTNYYVPNYETIFFHLHWGDKNQMMKEGYGYGWNHAVSCKKQSICLLFILSNDKTFLLVLLPLLSSSTTCHKNQNLQMHHSHREKQRKTETQRQTNMNLPSAAPLQLYQEAASQVLHLLDLLMQVRPQLAEHVAALCAPQSDLTPPAQSLLLLLRFWRSDTKL